MRFILEIMKRLNELMFLIDNKSDKNHTHDISNISGLQYLLSKQPAQVLPDAKQLKDLIRYETQPKFILKFESTEDTAIVIVTLVTMNGYCMDGIVLNVQYQQAFDGGWIQIPGILYNGAKEYIITLNDLEPNVSYHVELTIKDIHNPMLSIITSDMFRTGVISDD